MATNKTMTINGFKADILSEKKTVTLKSARSINPVFVEVPAEQRITSKFISGLVAQHMPEASSVLVRHSRYVRYSLRTVMTERSGQYRVESSYRQNSGRWVQSSRVVKNDAY